MKKINNLLLNEVDYDALARANRDANREERFVGGYNRPLSLPIIKKNEFDVDNPSTRKQLTTLKSEIESHKKDKIDAEKAILDLEETLKYQIDQIKKIKRNLDATKLRIDIQKKIKETKELRKLVKHNISLINRSISSNEKKIEKILIKANKNNILESYNTFNVEDEELTRHDSFIHDDVYYLLITSYNLSEIEADNLIADNEELIYEFHDQNFSNEEIAEYLLNPEKYQ